MLRVSLVGNMGADPEVRYTPKGTQVTSIRVAVNQVKTAQDGERQETTEWFRVRVLGRQAEYAQRLAKGTRVLVVGRLEISHFQSRDGEARTGFDVWCDEIQALTPRGATLEPNPETEPEAVGAGVSSLSRGRVERSAANGAPSRRAAAEDPPEDLEDLPF